MNKLKSYLTIAGFGLAITTSHISYADGQNVEKIGALTVLSPAAQHPSASHIDFANAIPMPTPKSSKKPSSQASDTAPAFSGLPGFSLGSEGDGKQTPTLLPQSHFITDDDGVAPREFGTAKHPYSTSRVNASGNTTSRYYPYSAAGKLFFTIGRDTYVCSASLVRKGVIVTAAHCVADYGSGEFYDNWTFVPALDNGTAPYGTWDWSNAVVLSSYIDGFDSCAVSGVVCKNDVAVILLEGQGRRANKYPGTNTGWFGYGWNGYSYTSFLGKTSAQISQLGYSEAIDGGLFMQNTDSLGYVDTSSSNNTVIGSLQTGGSSGAPFLVNLGVPPSLDGTQFGSDANHNIVVGVTSWGYIKDAVKEEGASPFTSDNIKFLVDYLCPTTTSPGC